MTVFGWDASHYDAPPTARDGIDFYTHKVTEGDRSYADPEYRQAMLAVRNLGIPILGSYHVQHGGVSASRQAAYWVATVDAATPWWADHPCWTWQIDAEKFDYMTAPTIDEVNALGDEIVRVTGCSPRRVLAYAPTWVYGAGLTRLRYQLWASNYGANPVGHYQTVYPGDRSPRWRAPVEPLILQYGSRATIAGQTTCDANAYRGSLTDLLTALDGGDMPLTPQDVSTLLGTRLGRSTVTVAQALQDTHGLAQRLIAAAAADETRDAVALAAVEALATTGGIDAAPIVAAIRQEATTTRQVVRELQLTVEDLHEQVAAAQATIAGLRAQLADRDTRLAAALMPATVTVTGAMAIPPAQQG